VSYFKPDSYSASNLDDLAPARFDHEIIGLPQMMPRQKRAMSTRWESFDRQLSAFRLA
jgi:hypothetical protein